MACVQGNTDGTSQYLERSTGSANFSTTLSLGYDADYQLPLAVIVSDVFSSSATKKFNATVDPPCDRCICPDHVLQVSPPKASKTSALVKQAISTIGAEVKTSESTLKAAVLVQASASVLKNAVENNVNSSITAKAQEFRSQLLNYTKQLLSASTVSASSVETQAVATRVLCGTDTTSLSTEEQNTAFEITQALVNRSLALGAATTTAQKASVTVLSHLLKSGILGGPCRTLSLLVVL